MLSKNTTPGTRSAYLNWLHKTLAHEIKAAKKAMFKRHREGMALKEAAHRFVVDMVEQFHDVVPDHEPPLTSAEFAAMMAKRKADDAPAHTPDILTDEQVDYAISQMVELSRTGPNSGLAALIKHFRDLVVTGRAGEAKEDAEKCLRALAREPFDRESRIQFLEDFKLGTGENDDEERIKAPTGEETAADRQRVANALSELLCNPATPRGLFEQVADFTTTATNGPDDVRRAIYWRPEVLEKLIKFIDDPMGPFVKEGDANASV